MIPSCDHTGVPIHFHSSTTSGSASLMSLRILLKVSPRQSPSSAIRLSISPDADSFMSSSSAQLLDTDEVARGIADRAVANPPRLLGWLLGDLGVAGLQPLERAVEVGGGQEEAGLRGFGPHLGD